MGATKIITSRDNPTVKALRALAVDARETRRQRRTLLDGPHLIDAFHRHLGAPDMLVISESGVGNEEIGRLLDRLPATETVQIPDSLFREVSGVATPVGILAVIAIPDAPFGSIEGSCVMLDAIQDAGNVGAILRTAAAAGIRDVMLGPGCAGPWTPRVLRAAQGAHFVLRIRDQTDLAAMLHDYKGTSVATVARNGIPLFELELGGDVAWIFGNEGAGIADAIAFSATRRATIPLAADTESLNVAAAAAVCLFEGVRQRRWRKGETNA
ncbi:MAG TPA: RNA methyltransferase [Rhodocyclaceae bacterium]|nr:RNA methyltransferase [Rhodocyclaceae bacterium]